MSGRERIEGILFEITGKPPLEEHIDWIAERIGDLDMENDDVIYENKMLIHDAQTSGGLLICVPSKHKEAIVQDLIKSGYPHTAIIGEVIAKTEKLVNVY